MHGDKKGKIRIRTGLLPFKSAGNIKPMHCTAGAARRATHELCFFWLKGVRQHKMLLREAYAKGVAARRLPTQCLTVLKGGRYCWSKNSVSCRSFPIPEAQAQKGSQRKRVRRGFHELPVSKTKRHYVSLRNTNGWIVKDLRGSKSEIEREGYHVASWASLCISWAPMRIAVLIPLFIDFTMSRKR